MGSLCMICIQSQDKLYNILQIDNLFQIFNDFVRRDITNMNTLSTSICYRCLFKIENAKEVFLSIRRIIDQQNSFPLSYQSKRFISSGGLTDTSEFKNVSNIKNSLSDIPVEVATEPLDSKDECKNLLRPVSYRSVDTLSTESGGVIVLDEELVASQKKTKFRCQVCMATFQTNTALSQHERTHRKKAIKKEQRKSEEKVIFSCKVCKNTYTTYTHFSLHAKYHVFKFVCRFCNAGFINANDCEWHEPTCESLPKTENRVRTRSQSRLSKSVEKIDKKDNFNDDLELFCDRIYISEDITDENNKERSESVLSTTSSRSASRSHRSRSRNRKTRWTRRKRSKYNTGPLIRKEYVESTDDDDIESDSSTYPSVHSSRIDILNRQQLHIKTRRHYPPQKTYYCSSNTCHFNSPDIFVVVKHEIDKHKALALYSCKVCKKDFTSNKFLSQHRRIAHPEGPLMCIYCEKCCLTQRSLMKHMIEHQKILKDFRCQACGFQFLTQELLTNHWMCTTDSKHLLHDRIELNAYRQWNSPSYERNSSPSECSGRSTPSSIITISNVTSLAGSRPTTPFPEGLPIEFPETEDTPYEFETLQDIGYGENGSDPSPATDHYHSDSNETVFLNNNSSPVNITNSHDTSYVEDTDMSVEYENLDDIEICPTGVQQ